MVSNIKEIYTLIDYAYRTRDISIIKESYSQLFHKDSKVIGTSMAELCFTKDEIIKLFEDDFQGWGDFNLDLDSIFVNEAASHVFATCKATLKVSFGNQTKIHDAMLKEVNSIDNKHKNKKLSGTEISWLLTHILHGHVEPKREYLWPFELTMVCSIYDKKPIIDLLDFSYVFSEQVYDSFLNMDPYDDQLFAREIVKMKNTSSAHESSLLKKNIKKWIQDEIDLLDEIKTFEIFVSDEIQEKSFIAIGSFIRSFDYDQFYHQAMETFRNQENSPEKALFDILRDLNYAMRQEQMGVREIPFRVVGICDDAGEIIQGKISYPYQIILENKSTQERKL